MAKKSDPATKDDVERIVNKVVTDVVGEVATEILNVMAEQFEQMDKKMDKRFKDMDGRMNSLENMVRPTADKVDNHEVRLKRLEAKAA
jgi:hypothetical protein